MELDTVIRKWVRNEALEASLASSASALYGESPEDKSIVIDIPGVDTEKGLSFYGKEKDIYLSILRSFVVNTPKLLDKLRVVSAETLRDYVINVHGLKGTCANIGAETTREAALNLETMSRAGNLEYVLANNGNLITGAEIVVANVRAWLENYDVKTEDKPRLKAPDRELLAHLRQSCEKYDMSGIDEAMLELEKADYEEDAELVAWLRERIDVSEMGEVAQRLAGYLKENSKNGQ
jgi:HPt (histidine-containing phosphotransfer) domain-containing protein